MKLAAFIKSGRGAAGPKPIGNTARLRGVLKGLFEGIPPGHVIAASPKVRQAMSCAAKRKAKA